MHNDRRMAGHECYHCKQWIDDGVSHDCWTTTEGALTRDLPGDILDAWERLRETAASFGEQRIYASHKSIMFSRKSCYFFVRPRMSALEVCIFLGRTIRSPRIRRTMSASRTKIVHVVHVRHRDEVEAPLTDWLLEAYDTSEKLSGARATRTATRPATRGKGARTAAARGVTARKPAARTAATRGSSAAAPKRR
jgi:hypothetical protein